MIKFILFTTFDSTETSHRHFEPLGQHNFTCFLQATVLWLPPHLMQAQPCPFFLQATVLWLPPHLIQAQPCPFFLQATVLWLPHISFEFSHVHSFSRPQSSGSPTSHSSSAMSILSPGHSHLAPPHLIRVQPCPFFLQATVLWLPPHLIRVQPCPFLYTPQRLSC